MIKHYFINAFRFQHDFLIWVRCNYFSSASLFVCLVFFWGGGARANLFAFPWLAYSFVRSKFKPDFDRTLMVRDSNSHSKTQLFRTPLTKH